MLGVGSELQASSCIKAEDSLRYLGCTKRGVLNALANFLKVS